MELTIAECARCGTEIEFATSEEFEKLVDEHIHRYPLGQMSVATAIIVNKKKKWKINE